VPTRDRFRVAPRVGSGCPTDRRGLRLSGKRQAPGYCTDVATAPRARHLLRAKDLIDYRYFESLTIPVLAGAARLSPAHFRREFRRTFGETPHHYLLTRRLERAAALLRNTDRKVAEICMSVGLSSVGSFTTSFSRYFGCSPTVYRAKFPPAADRARIPACVMQAWGRPQENGRFREDDAKQTV